MVVKLAPFLFYTFTCSKSDPLQKAVSVLWARCPSCHPTINVKTPNTNQWPGTVLSSFTTGFLMPFMPTLQWQHHKLWQVLWQTKPFWNLLFGCAQFSCSAYSLKENNWFISADIFRSNSKILNTLPKARDQSGESMEPVLKKTKSSAIAEGLRDASCQLKSCQLPRNRAVR